MLTVLDVERLVSPIRPGIEAFKRGEARKALDLLEADREAYPDNPFVHNYLGRCYYMLNDVQRAHGAFRRAVQLSPDFPPEFADFYNLIRVRHHHQFPREDRPRILLGGAHPHGYWNTAFRCHCDTITLVQSVSLQQLNESVIKYGPETSLADILKLLPSGWNPEYLVFFIPEFARVPLGLEEAPFTTVTLPMDLESGGVRLVEILKCFDAVGTIVGGSAQVLKELGMKNALYAPIEGVVSAFYYRTHTPRRYDISFIGGLDRSGFFPMYRRRDRLLQRVLRLGDRYNVLVKESVGDDRAAGPNYVRILNESKIAFCCSGTTYTTPQGPPHAGHLQPKYLEVAACGALCFIEADNTDVREFFVDGEHAVYYTEDDLEDLLVYYLEEDEKRERIAEQGYRKVLAHGSFVERVAPFFQTLEGAGVRRGEGRIVREPGSDERLLGEGVFAFYADEQKVALDRFRKVAEGSGPRRAEALNNLGVLTVLLAHREEKDRLTRFGEAMRMFELASQLRPQLVRASYNRLAVAHQYGLENVDAFAQSLLRLLAEEEALHPDDLDRGLFYYPELASSDTMHRSLLRTLFGIALTRFPGRKAEYCEHLRRIYRCRAHAILGQRAFALGDRAAARAAFEEAIDALDEEADLRYNAGMLAFEMGDVRAAQAHLRGSVERRPFDVMSKLMLARCLYLRGEVDSLRRHCQDGLLTNVTQPERNYGFHYYLALAACLRGDEDGTERHLSDFLGSVPPAGPPADEPFMDERAWGTAQFANPVPPSPVENRRGLSFLLMPRWNNDTSTWKTVLREFIAAFELREDVSLLVHVDTSQVRLEDVQGPLSEVIHSSGKEPQRIPDIVIMQDDGGPLNCARLIAAADAYLVYSETALAQETLLAKAARKPLLLKPDAQQLREFAASFLSRQP